VVGQRPQSLQVTVFGVQPVEPLALGQVAALLPLPRERAHGGTMPRARRALDPLQRLLGAVLAPQGHPPVELRLRVTGRGALLQLGVLLRDRGTLVAAAVEGRELLLGEDVTVVAGPLVPDPGVVEAELLLRLDPVHEELHLVRPGGVWVGPVRLGHGSSLGDVVVEI